MEKKTFTNPPITTIDALSLAISYFAQSGYNPELSLCIDRDGFESICKIISAEATIPVEPYNSKSAKTTLFDDLADACDHLLEYVNMTINKDFIEFYNWQSTANELADNLSANFINYVVHSDETGFSEKDLFDFIKKLHVKL